MSVPAGDGQYLFTRNEIAAEAKCDNCDLSLWLVRQDEGGGQTWRDATGSRLCPNAPPGVDYPSGLHVPATRDPSWLAEMRIATARRCDECGSAEGLYSAGGPGHFTTCRKCATEGACMRCGGPLTEVADPQYGSVSKCDCGQEYAEEH